MVEDDGAHALQEEGLVPGALQVRQEELGRVADGGHVAEQDVVVAFAVNIFNYIFYVFLHIIDLV